MKPAGLALLAALAALAVAWAAAPAQAQDPARTMHWSATLPRTATTSAGIYDVQSRLVRTLWRAEPMAAGERSGSWDGRDDAGRAVADGRYEMRLIHHRLRYVWEGVVGNSSTTLGEPFAHKAYLPPTSLVVSGERAIYAVGYNEWQPGLHGFALAAPERNTRPFVSIDPFVAYTMLAADATRLYWANGGGLSRTSFVGAFDLRSAEPAGFATGRAVCLRTQGPRCHDGQDYQGVIDVDTTPDQAATGLAVQRDGRVLAVAHAGRLRLFDKVSGALLNQLELPLAAKALNQIAMTPSGDLWVIAANTVRLYTDLERTPTLVTTLTGPTRPVALATAPTGDAVWVADGGASQQLKRFERDGTASATLGRAGGYTGDPQVAADKLCFRGRDGREQTALALTADARVWVVDSCNNRMLRFAADAGAGAASDAQIAYLPAVYTATVDHAAPRRVFANFLEFEADTETPWAPGRSWKLVRNWLAGLPAALNDEHAFNGLFGGLSTVETLANGRTYGLLTAHGRQAIVELPAAGPLRLVKLLGAELPGTTRKVMYENGDLGYALSGAGTQRAMRLPLTGFDQAGDPVWASEPIVLASVPMRPGTPFYRGAFSGTLGPRFPLTGSGRVVFFDQSVSGNEGFHLGAAQRGADGWLWQTSPSAALDTKGSFPTKVSAETLHYGGNAVWADGRHIVYGYHGEGYRDAETGRVGQANQFMHYDESGLFLGQFGQPSTRPGPAAQAGLSGNAFSPTLVRIGTRLYLYHNDESSHGGVHRWRIDGADDVQTLRGDAPLGGTLRLR